MSPHAFRCSVGSWHDWATPRRVSACLGHAACQQDRYVRRSRVPRDSSAFRSFGFQRRQHRCWAFAHHVAAFKALRLHLRAVLRNGPRPRPCVGGGAVGLEGPKAVCRARRPYVGRAWGPCSGALSTRRGSPVERGSLCRRPIELAVASELSFRATRASLWCRSGAVRAPLSAGAALRRRLGSRHRSNSPPT